MIGHEGLKFFWIVELSVIFQRANFNCGCHKDSKTVEEFITVLYSLVEMCNYGGPKE